MKLRWKIAAPVGCVALICAAAITWHFVKARATERKRTEHANAARVRAEQGDAKAQAELASRYYYGKGVPQDYREAVHWYRKAADQGSAEAQYYLAFMYEEGKGVPQDYTEAINWCRKAADQGNTRAQYALGYTYFEGRAVPQDYTKAFLWYRKAADQGYAEAQSDLGYMYAQGKGVPQDYTEAVSWYRKAADLGYVKGQHALGYAYSEGKGVPRDYAQSAGWYRKAADQGDAQAQDELGFMYSQGMGVPRDYAEAARWYRKAAKQGDKYARRALDSMNIGFTTERKINLSAVFLACMLLLIGSSGNIRDRQQRRVTLGALLGLLWVGLTVYGDSHFGILESLSAVNMFYFGKGLLTGIGLAMLLSFVWPQLLKIAVWICGTLFIGFNIYAITHYNLRHFAACPRAFYSINALLTGTAITLAFLLWLEGETTKGTQNGNDGVTPETVAGSGIEPLRL